MIYIHCLLDAHLIYNTEEMWEIHEISLGNKLIALFSPGWTENHLKLDQTGRIVHI